MKISTVLKWAALAFVVWFIVTQPHAAAQVTRGIGEDLSAAGRGIAAFLAGI
jgi:hypothetical protein